MIYVYGIVDTRCFKAIRGEGHARGDVTPVPSGRLAAAVSEWPDCSIASTPRNVLRHERVLERLMHDHTVLPLRFGMICGDRERLEKRLLETASELLGDFDRVRGGVEFALRLAGADDLDILDACLERGHSAPPDRTVHPATVTSAAAAPDAAVGRGTAYVREKQQRLRGEADCQRKLAGLEALLHRYLDVGLKGLICLPSADASPGFRISCLVERTRIGLFEHALDRLRTDHKAISLTCTGPWAPYSFTAAPGLGGGQ